MIIDKKGKICGKVSIIDIFICLILIVLIAGISIRFISAPSKNAKSKIPLTYVVEIDGVSQFTVDAFDNKSKVIDAKQKCVVGEIVDVVSRPKTEDKFDNDGNLISAEVPEKYVVDVTISSEAKESDSGYYVGNDTEVSVGSTIKIATKYVNTSGKVISIKK